MARQSGAVRSDRQEQVAPAVHAGFRALFVVVRRDEDQLHRRAGLLQPFAILVHFLFRPHQLGFGRHQSFPVFERPAVILAGGQLDVVRPQALAQGHDVVHLVDVVAVDHEVEHHWIAGFLHRPGHGQLLVKGLSGAGHGVVQLRVGRLEADLDMVQSCLGKSIHLGLGQAQP